MVNLFNHVSTCWSLKKLSWQSIDITSELKKLQQSKTLHGYFFLVSPGDPYVEPYVPVMELKIMINTNSYLRDHSMVNKSFRGVRYESLKLGLAFVAYFLK